MRVSIVTEGGGMRGYGHVSRTCALGQGFVALGHEALLCIDWAGEGPPVAPSGIEVLPVKWLENPERLFPLTRSADVTVMDSYLAGGDVFHRVAAESGLMVSIDDSARISYPPGIVCNGTPYGRSLDYPAVPGVTYLLGPEYSLLRKGFWNLPARTFREGIERVMVTLGGGPVAPLVEQIVVALASFFPNVFIEVLTASESAPALVAFLHDDESGRWPEGSGGIGRVSVHGGIGDAEVAALMAECDAAVTAGGQTLCEAAAAGLPAVCVNLAENQELIIESLTSGNAAFCAGSHGGLDLLDNIISLMGRMNLPELRRSMSEAGRRLVKPGGALKTAEVVSALVSGEGDRL